MNLRKYIFLLKSDYSRIIFHVSQSIALHVYLNIYKMICSIFANKLWYLQKKKNPYFQINYQFSTIECINNLCFNTNLLNYFTVDLRSPSLKMFSVDSWKIFFISHEWYYRMNTFASKCLRPKATLGQPTPNPFKSKQLLKGN